MHHYRLSFMVVCHFNFDLWCVPMVSMRVCYGKNCYYYYSSLIELGQNVYLQREFENIFIKPTGMPQKGAVANLHH